MNHTVTILMTEFVTHDVKRFIVSKPEAFSFEPGQGVELAIKRPGWSDKGRAFTPTSLPDDAVLEFTIKAYPQHNGVTQELHRLTAGDELSLSEPFGTISYKGRGTFIAGGAGITPFLAIMRNLARRGETAGHTLLFSNKTPADIICEKELRHYFGERCFFTCTHESAPGYANRRIDGTLLEELIDDYQQHFYLCGPPAFSKGIGDLLKQFGATPDTLVFEQ
jgi:ferredoxin-NADP reductase